MNMMKIATQIGEIMDYDTWKTTPPWDYDPPTPADYGWVHEDDIPDLDHAKDMLEGVLEAIYVTGNIEKLEDCLDELTGCFELKIPATAPLLEKKGMNKNLLQAFAGFTQHYAEALTKRTTRWN